MTDKISVIVFRRGGRKFWQMQWTDHATGKKPTRSTGATNRRDAERAAAAWQAEILAGRDKRPSRTTWADFRERYETEVLPGLAIKTDSKVSGVFNSIERILQPQRLRDLTAERLSTWLATMREERIEMPAETEGGPPTEKIIHRSENTLKSCLATLLAALNWAKSIGMLVEVPKVQAPRRAKGAKTMKGRPITLEEFERMLAKVPDVVWPTRKRDKPLDAAGEAAKAAAVASWCFYLRGLWLSGLRLAESLELYWDRDDRLCVVDLASPHPMLRIPAELEKGHCDRLMPLAPEFAEFLLEVPTHRRHGRVFMLKPRRAHHDCITAEFAGRVVSEIGEQAGVKVSTDPVTKAVKFASAHDLRRSFGARWSNRVMPQVLKELMRHESIDTTLRYYVGRNAQSTAAVLWDAHRAANKPAAPAVAATFAATDDSGRDDTDDHEQQNATSNEVREYARRESNTEPAD